MAQVNGSAAAWPYVVSQSPPAFEPPFWSDDLTAFVSFIQAAGPTLDLEVMDYFPLIMYQTPEVYWPVLDDALRAASIINNTNIRFLIGYWDHTSPSMLDYLRSLNALPNIDVRLFIVPPYNPPIPFTRVNHAKWGVSSSQLYVTTSNWVGDYYTNTAGASILTPDPQLRDIGVAIFERDWYSQYTVPLPANTSVLNSL
jgi:phospholipase D3/4